MALIQSGKGIAGWLRFLLSTLMCAMGAGLVFFALLGLWGLAVAPFVSLRSASFVIIVALACSSVLTIAAYRVWYSRFSPRRLP